MEAVRVRYTIDMWVPLEDEDEDSRADIEDILREQIEDYASEDLRGQGYLPRNTGISVVDIKYVDRQEVRVLPDNI